MIYVNAANLFQGAMSKMNKNKNDSSEEPAKNSSYEVEVNNQEKIKIKINGTWYDFELGRDVQTADTLSYLLKERMGFTGLKVACDEGACGACTIIMNGEAVLSCMTLAVEADGHDILTIEGLADDDPVVKSFADQ